MKPRLVSFSKAPPRPVLSRYVFRDGYRPSGLGRRITRRAVSNVSSVSKAIGIEDFRVRYYIPEKPLIIHDNPKLPALIEWFQQNGNWTSLSPKVTSFSPAIFPYELVWTGESSNRLVKFHHWLQNQRDEDAAQVLPILDDILSQVAQAGEMSFHQFYAPLGLLVKAIEFNGQQNNGKDRIKRLYIAQSPLNDLPQPLKGHVPAPDLIHAGQGDIYDSSIWLGLEPTYTPLHRDPNPNLFVQLLSRKVIRLLPPSLGEELYAQVQSRLRSNGNPRFRGQEMMEGPERAALYEAVWGPLASEKIEEAVLSSKDTLFIPKGWWHSVCSASADGHLNVSANWWFR